MLQTWLNVNCQHHPRCDGLPREVDNLLEYHYPVLGGLENVSANDRRCKHLATARHIPELGPVATTTFPQID